MQCDTMSHAVISFVHILLLASVHCRVVGLVQGVYYTVDAGPSQGLFLCILCHSVSWRSCSFWPPSQIPSDLLQQLIDGVDNPGSGWVHLTVLPYPYHQGELSS